MLLGLVRSRRSLEAENLALRHQLNVLHRRAPKRPALRDFDRLLFVCLYRIAPRILDTFTIVQPETVLRWDRAGFRSFWRWKSRRRAGRPSVTPEIRRLIREMSLANPGALPASMDELLKLGIDVGQTSVAKYMAPRRRPSIARLENVPPKSCRRDRLDRPVRGSDALISAAIRIARSPTRPAANYVDWRHRAHPTAEWIARQITEACGWEAVPNYLVRARDRLYAEAFTRRIRAMGIRDRPTAPRSPWQNGYRTTDRLDQTRMPGSRDHNWRATPAPYPAFVPAILQRHPNAPVIGQGLTADEAGAGRVRNVRT